MNGNPVRPLPAALLRSTTLAAAVALAFPVSAQNFTQTSTQTSTSTHATASCHGANGRFETRPETALLTPGNCNLPDRRPVPVSPAAAKIARMVVEVDRDGVPADGQTPVQFVVRLFGADGRPLAGEATVTIEHSGGRIQLPDASAATPARGDLDRVTPGVQVRAANGEARFLILAPHEPQDVKVRLTAGGAEVSGHVSFLPELRELIATGFFEGILARNERGDQSRSDDAFERDIRKFSHTSRDGRTTTAAQSMFYLRGVVKGDALLTMAYDSDRATRSRLFRDIRPEEFYPIYGDASIKGFDARSSQKFYVRVDRNRSFLLFGDFTTRSLFEGQALGNYQRSLTGVQGRAEGRRAVVTGFASRDTLRQVVEEMPARGVSGPYIVGNSNGVRNSEKVEIVTRDRNQPASILAIVPMTRFEDYTFEPFSGQVVFKSPVPTVDANFNPLTVRITYEVDGGGEDYTVGGVEGRVNVGGGLSVGAGAVQDRNPIDRFELQSGNAAWQLGERTRVTAEGARTERNGTAGNAGRVEMRHAGERLEARIAVGQTDRDFRNPSAVMQSGRREGQARATWSAQPGTQLYGEALTSEDRATGARRDAGQAGVRQRLSERVTVDVGVRSTRDEGGPVNAAAAGVSNIAIGQSYEPYQVGASPTLQPAPHLTNTTTARARITVEPTARSQVWGESESNFDGANRWGAGANYQIAERTRLYGRYEWLESLSGGYGLGPDGRAQLFTAGVMTEYMRDGQLFSEMRLRDAFGSQEASAATGLRNLWSVADGVRFITGVERVQALAGDRREATALAGGVELTYDPRWKASGRVEWRQDNLTQAWLSTLAYTARIDQDWSFIARNYLNAVEARSAALGDRFQDRAQVGFAWRPVAHNHVNGLARYEHRIEKDSTPGATFARNADIVSGHLAFHPVRRLWLNGRLAAKWATEDMQGLQSRYSAYMAGGRVIHDITDRIDLGVLAAALWSPDGNTLQHAQGLEAGVLVAKNFWISGGYNWRGFRDRDLTSGDYTQRGLYLRLRWKFDEDLFASAKMARSVGD